MGPDQGGTHPAYGPAVVPDTVANVSGHGSDRVGNHDVHRRQLLGMTSGIPDHANTRLVLSKVVDDPKKVRTVAEIIDPGGGWIEHTGQTSAWPATSGAASSAGSGGANR